MKLTAEDAGLKRERFSELLLDWYQQAHEPTACLDEAIAFLLAQEYKKFEWAKLRIFLSENGFECSCPNRYFLETYIRQMRPLPDEAKFRIRELAQKLHLGNPASTIKELVHRVIEKLQLQLESGQKDQVNREIRLIVRQTGQNSPTHEVPEECTFSYLML